MERWKRLLEQASAAAKAARAIAEKAEAENREMTGDERAEFDRKFAEATQFKADSDTAKKDADVMAQAKALAELTGMPDSATADPDGGGDGREKRYRDAKSLGQQVVGSPQFKAMMKAFGGRIPDGARVHSDPINVKALLTGGSDTSGGAFVVPDQSGIVEMLGRRPLVIRDVISIRQTESDSVEFVREVSHTNAAAPVPEATTSALPTAPGTAGALVPAAGGGYKPEGAWAFERDATRVVTIAEWVPATKRSLSDVKALQGLIDDELRADLAETEENEIVNGDGTGEHLTGIYHTSGIQEQPFDTDLFVTLRKALTKARTVGRVVVNGIGMHPADVEQVDLARDGNNRYYGNGPFALGPNTVWGRPIIESEAFVEGSPVVADFRKYVVWDREQATVTMSDSHADFFVRNLVAVLGEQREAGVATRPSAFVVCDITA